MSIDSQHQISIPEMYELRDMRPGLCCKILHFNYLYPLHITIERLIDARDPIIIYSFNLNGIDVPSYLYASEVSMMPVPDSSLWSNRKFLLPMHSLTSQQEAVVQNIYGHSNAKIEAKRRLDIHPGTRLDCLGI